ncbi:carbon storage regulator CsrA [Patescibacteria group bacterium]|nr:carbon storage regulator CsrA [Patescibacteria group bacterium]
MLIISRKRSERIMIGDDIAIIIVDIRGDQVQVGIDAPRSIPVHRHEIYEAIKAGNLPTDKK